MYTYEITKKEVLQDDRYANYWYDILKDGLFYSNGSLFSVEMSKMNKLLDDIIGGMNV